MYLLKRNGIFYIGYTDSDQKTRRISTKSRAKSEANKFLRSFSQKLTQEKNLQQVNLRSFINEYGNLIESTRSKKYHLSVLYSFKTLEWNLGEIFLLNINGRQMESFIINQFQKKKYATALHYRNLKAAFNKAMEWNYIMDNPMLKVKLPSIAKEYLELILVNTPSEMLRELFTTAFYTGLRLGEIVNLKWSQINLSAGILLVANTSTFVTKNKQY